MKKNPLFLLLFVQPFSLINCNSSNQSINSYSSDDIASLKSTYGSFSITRNDNLENNYSYDEESNTYTFNVEETKSEYVLKGYTDAHFVIVNNNNISSYKGIHFHLNKACIVSTDNNNVFTYTLNTKNIEIDSTNNTKNKIISLGEGNTIDSESNIEITGKGSLELYSKGATTGGHTLRANESISLYEEVNLIINSGHDGFHCDNFYSYQLSDSTNVYKGTCQFGNVVSQAFEGTTNKCNGSIYLTGGTYIIEKCDSVFKSDVTIQIAKGVSVKATSTSSSPVVKQSQDELGENVLIPDLKLVVEGSFKANNLNIESQTY